MGFTRYQTRVLAAPLAAKHVRIRTEGETALHYLEGWHVMDQANRLFGFDGWDRETLLLEPLQVSFQEPAWHAAYQARVRVTVWSPDGPVARDGTGVGHGTNTIQAKAKDIALKAAETDATKRAFATFGNKFGLCLYDPSLTHVEGLIEQRPPSPPWSLLGADGSSLGLFRAAADYCGGLRRLLQGTDDLGLLSRLWALNFPELSRLVRETPNLKNQAGLHYAEILRRTYEHRLEDLLMSRPTQDGTPALPDQENTQSSAVLAETAKQLAPRVGPSATARDNRIDKSELTIGAPPRRRDKNHLRYVAGLSCLVCGRKPSQAHHITYAQRRGLGQKVSDEFTVPLCTIHHRQLHDHGNEKTWWATHAIDPLDVAAQLWAQPTEAHDRSSHGPLLHDPASHAAKITGADGHGRDDLPLKAGAQQS
ncbi:Rad52/Rad22 family DNA repair protein [Pyruvatibacter sp.]|uniref:Rad52/Rad22 family DNA repair protein n=1 Tax=Pyruvatibacter sp. TaxID=1981328 RepID=UPI0032EE754D